MWPAITALALPLLGGLFGIIRGDDSSRLSRRIRHNAELVGLVNDIPDAKKNVASLVVLQTAELKAREQARLKRKINSANLTLAIILLLISAGLIYALSLLVVAWWPIGTGGIALSILIVAGLFLLLLTGAGFATIYNAPKPKATSSSR